MKCIFCEIIHKQSPAEIIIENDDVISFLDVRPMNFGHALVVPKSHCANFLELPADKIPALFGIAQQIAASVVNALNADGFNLMINNGKVAGQSVFHLHVHIIPRYSTDSFKFRPVFKQYKANELAEIGNKIRESL